MVAVHSLHGQVGSARTTWIVNPNTLHRLLSRCGQYYCLQRLKSHINLSRFTIYKYIITYLIIITWIVHLIAYSMLWHRKIFIIGFVSFLKIRLIVHNESIVVVKPSKYKGLILINFCIIYSNNIVLYVHWRLIDNLNNSMSHQKRLSH